jgi:hypothetical protein
MEYIILACRRIPRKGKKGMYYKWIILTVDAKTDEEAMVKFWNLQADRARVHIYAVFCRQRNFLTLRYFSPFVVVADDAQGKLKEIVNTWERLLGQINSDESRATGQRLFDSLSQAPDDRTGKGDQGVPGTTDFPSDGQQ